MNHSEIQKLAILYKEKFHMGWISDFEWNSEDSATSLEKTIKIVDLFEHESFRIISKSVLSGEYIVRPNISDDLDELLTLLDDGEELLDDTNKDKSAAIQDFNSLLSSVSKILRKYRYFLTIVKNKYSYKHIRYVVNAYRQQKESRQTVRKYQGLYEVLFELSYIDHFLASDNNAVVRLILMHAQLEDELKKKLVISQNEDNKLIVDILNQKCLFLIKKLLIEDNKKDFDFLIDFVPRHYDASTLNISSFKELDEKFEFYRNEVYSNESYTMELDAEAINRSLKIGEYALLMKCYKDSPNTVLSQIENILADYKKLHSILWSKFDRRPFDRYALNTLENYMYNCYLSFRMKDDNYTFGDLSKDILEVVDMQRRTGVYNFYPFRKAIEFILKTFKTNSELSEKDMGSQKKLLQKCITWFEDAIEWCHATKFYPIQCLYNECIVTVDKFGAVFIASNYCRPVKYEKLKDELNRYKNQLLSIGNEIEVRKERIEISKVRKEIDESRMKQVEILSFFTAIITFLFGTIGFFAKNENVSFYQLVSSIFGLGGVLLIFVCGIHLVTMRREKSFRDYFYHPRMWFCLFTIIVSIIGIIWLLMNN